MMEIFWALIPALAVLVGYWLGRRHAREDALRMYDRMLRIEPPDRRPGLPTNREAPPSRVVRARITRDRYWNP